MNSLEYEACRRILPKFKKIARDVWGKSVDQIDFKCEKKTEKPQHLASLKWDARCKPIASGNLLLRYCCEYTLQLSSRIKELNEKQLNRALKHEAIHIGYPRHTKEFFDLALKINAPFSELTIGKNQVIIESKNNGRYKPIMIVSTPEEAKVKAHEYAKQHPDEKVRWKF